MTSSPPSDPIAEYYNSRSAYTTIVDTSHSKLPLWRDSATKTNRVAADESSPFVRNDEIESERRSGILGDEEEKIKEGMRELLEKFKKAEMMKDGNKARENGGKGKGAVVDGDRKK